MGAAPPVDCSFAAPNITSPRRREGVARPAGRHRLDFAAKMPPPEAAPMGTSVAASLESPSSGPFQAVRHNVGPAAPPSIPLVRAITIERLPDLLDRMNVRLDVLMRRAGLPEVPFDQQGDFLPLREVLAVVEGAARATGIEHFGLLLATTGGLEKIGDYGRHMAEAPTLLEAIRRAARYISWHTLGSSLALTAEGEACVWRYSFPRTIRDYRQHGYPFALVVMRDLVRLAAGPYWTPFEVRLEQAISPGFRRQLQEVFGPHVKGSAGVNALVFPQSLLALPLSWRRHGFAAAGAGGTGLMLAPDVPPADFVGSVRRLVRTFLRAGYPSVGLLARASGLSVRSFQRALALSGTTFGDLVDEVRLQAAVEMMRDPVVRLADIGLELGYADPANFTRAFRRWTGQMPTSYRRALANGATGSLR
jgi:AraC-like DNA-binding protein